MPVAANLIRVTRPTCPSARVGHGYYAVRNGTGFITAYDYADGSYQGSSWTLSTPGYIPALNLLRRMSDGSLLFRAVEAAFPNTGHRIFRWTPGGASSFADISINSTLPDMAPFSGRIWYPIAGGAAWMSQLPTDIPVEGDESTSTSPGSGSASATPSSFIWIASDRVWEYSAIGGEWAQIVNGSLLPTISPGSSHNSGSPTSSGSARLTKVSAQWVVALLGDLASPEIQHTPSGWITATSPRLHTVGDHLTTFPIESTRSLMLSTSIADGAIDASCPALSVSVEPTPDGTPGLMVPRD